MMYYSNTTLVKVKWFTFLFTSQYMYYSNTTLVKVKYITTITTYCSSPYSNTTLVKVKFTGGTITGTAHLFKYNTC